MSNPEEYRRTRRIVDLLLRITGQPHRWTRRRLAEHYEISEQQMDKDLALIRHGLRMPLRHQAQGYYFERAPTLPSLTLSLPEALSLLLAARLGEQMPGVSRGDLAAALARVEALLPPELRPVARGLAQGPNGEEGERAALLRDLQLAMAEGARLRMQYRSASGAPELSERVVDPYTLVPYARSWYLVAYCHRRQEVREFKLDRIDAVARTGEPFACPEDFDLSRYLGPGWGLLRGQAGEPEEVVLEFEAETGRWVRDQELHPSRRVEDLPDGRVRLGFHVGITPELRRWVLGFGRRVRVVRPGHLAEWVRKEIMAMVELSEPSAGGEGGQHG